MRKVLLSAVVLFAFGSANAQDIKFGAKAGANFSTVKATLPGAADNFGSQENKMLFGFHVGGFAEFKLSDKFAIQPELLYSMQGSKYESNGNFFGFSFTGESDLKMSYLNVPVMAKYYATEKLFFVAGPQISFLLNAEQDSTFTDSDGETTTDNGVDVKDQFKSIDFSLGFGAGYFFTDNLFAEARYNIGLSNIAEPQTVDAGPFGQIEANGTAKTSNLQISLGYRF